MAYGYDSEPDEIPHRWQPLAPTFSGGRSSDFQASDQNLGNWLMDFQSDDETWSFAVQRLDRESMSV